MIPAALPSRNAPFFPNEVTKFANRSRKPPARRCIRYAIEKTLTTGLILFSIIVRSNIINNNNSLPYFSPVSRHHFFFRLNIKMKTNISLACSLYQSATARGCGVHHYLFFFLFFCLNNFCTVLYTQVCLCTRVRIFIISPCVRLTLLQAVACMCVCTSTHVCVCVCVYAFFYVYLWSY